MMENFYSRIDYLKKGLDGLWKRNEVISNNIANIDTHGYKAKDINFEQVFNNYEKKQKYFSKEIKYSIFEKPNLQEKSNGNNVDMDHEMANLSTNSMKFNLVAQEINFQLKLLETIMKDI